MTAERWRPIPGWPANFPLLDTILKPILITGHLPSPTRSIRAVQTPADSITAGGGL
jgi:hypothetical protein